MAKTEEDSTRFGYQPDIVEEYRVAPRRGEPKALHAHIYRPEHTTTGPAFVWFHGGGFRTGRITHGSHRAMARWLCKAGITVAYPEYRLSAQRADTEEDIASKVETLDDMAHPEFPARFRQVEALAALEDAVAFVEWLENQRESLGFEWPIFVGGSSAGGIIALNLLYVAPFLGLKTTPIGGAISISGGMAFPDMANTCSAPVFALHNPNDERVPYAPISDLADRNPSVSLVTAPAQDHGSLAFSPDEKKADSFGRIISKIIEFGQPADLH